MWTNQRPKRESITPYTLIVQSHFHLEPSLENDWLIRTTNAEKAKHQVSTVYRYIHLWLTPYPQFWNTTLWTINRNAIHSKLIINSNPSKIPRTMPRQTTTRNNQRGETSTSTSTPTSNNDNTNTRNSFFSWIVKPTRKIQQRLSFQNRWKQKGIKFHPKFHFIIGQLIIKVS